MSSYSESGNSADRGFAPRPGMYAEKPGMGVEPI